ncbi:hypothetical protein [uncultured Aquimarina sp.]|uniref:hypothetical protein n=1 Tax=uncultured Aquimarina sp. TaxID=575652 RepID=UPI00261C80F6|nr:hypothetical protein [uncultured Aquimarina sp.]
MIKDKIIYKGNPKESDLNRMNSETIDHTILKDTFSIPYAYIKKIENQKGKNYIKIFFAKDSEEELYINDDNIKSEIFEYIKNDHTDFIYSSELPSFVKYTKAQLFALVSITGIFIWSLYLAIQIESGIEYELVGGRKPGIAGVILIIANLGTFKIITGYLVLLAIAIFALIKKIKSRSMTEYLKR